MIKETKRNNLRPDKKLMMKRILLMLLIVIPGLSATSQTFPYNNEWIDYSKTYYKFYVGKTGLYRISQTVLASNGIGSIPAEQFQLWRNGREVPIYTSVPSGPLGEVILSNFGVREMMAFPIAHFIVIQVLF